MLSYENSLNSLLQHQLQQEIPFPAVCAGLRINPLKRGKTPRSHKGKRSYPDLDKHNDHGIRAKGGMREGSDVQIVPETFVAASDEFIIVSLSPSAPVKQEMNSLLQHQLQQEMEFPAECGIKDPSQSRSYLDQLSLLAKNL